MTLFGAIEWFFKEVGNRIGSPTPYFWRVIAGIHGFLVSGAGLVLYMSKQPGAHFPEKIIWWAQIIGAVSTAGILQSFLTKKDPPVPPNPPEQ